MRTCAYCGKPLTMKRIDAIYCSDACRQRSFQNKGVTDISSIHAGNDHDHR